MKRFVLTVAAASGLLAQTAAAAPFCVTNQAVPPQCIYHDAAICARDARQQGGTCATNPKEFKLAAGAGQYCVITTSQISLCEFADRNTCAQEATRQHGTCIDAPQRRAFGTPDPYSPINGN